MKVDWKKYEEKKYDVDFPWLWLSDFDSETHYKEKPEKSLAISLLGDKVFIDIHSEFRYALTKFYRHEGIDTEMTKKEFLELVEELNKFASIVKRSS